MYHCSLCKRKSDNQADMDIHIGRCPRGATSYRIHNDDTCTQGFNSVDSIA